MLATLKSGAEIRDLVETGSRVALDAFVVYYRPGVTAASPRLAIQISKRFGGAVRRNRLRRQIKEVCRSMFPRFTSSGDFVIIARFSAARLDYAGIRQVLERFFAGRGFLPTGGSSA